MVYRDRILDESEEDQEEEEEFFSDVADSVFKVGQWCLEMFQNHEKMLPNPAH